MVVATGVGLVVAAVVAEQREQAEAAEWHADQVAETLAALESVAAVARDISSGADARELVCAAAHSSMDAVMVTLDRTARRRLRADRRSGDPPRSRRAAAGGRAVGEPRRVLRPGARPDLRRLHERRRLAADHPEHRSRLGALRAHRAPRTADRRARGRLGHASRLDRSQDAGRRVVPRRRGGICDRAIRPAGRVSTRRRAPTTSPPSRIAVPGTTRSRTRSPATRRCASRCSTSTTSRSSTTSTATRPATACCSSARRPGRRGCARAICWPATAARSSQCSCAAASWRMRRLALERLRAATPHRHHLLARRRRAPGVRARRRSDGAGGCRAVRGQARRPQPPGCRLTYRSSMVPEAPLQRTTHGSRPRWRGLVRPECRRRVLARRRPRLLHALRGRCAVPADRHQHQRPAAGRAGIDVPPRERAGRLPRALGLRACS